MNNHQKTSVLILDRDSGVGGITEESSGKTSPCCSLEKAGCVHDSPGAKLSVETDHILLFMFPRKVTLQASVTGTS